MSNNRLTKLLSALLLNLIANNASALEHQFLGTLTDQHGLANSATFRMLTEGNKQYIRNVDITMTLQCDDTTGQNVQQLRINPSHTSNFIRLRKSTPIVVESEQIDRYTNHLVKVSKIKMTITNSSVAAEVTQTGNNGENCKGEVILPVVKGRNLKSEGFVPMIGKDEVDVEVTLDGRIPSVLEVVGLAECQTSNGLREDAQIQLSSLNDSMKVLAFHKNYFKVQLVSSGYLAEDTDAEIATIEGRIVTVKGQKQVKLTANLESPGFGQGRCQSTHKETLQKDF